MALAKTGGGVTDIRGGFGGVYFTRDRSGLHSSAKPRRVHQQTAAQRKQRNAFIAARTLSKDNRTVSYLMYRHMNDLPIAPHCDVTGNPVPDCTGRYILAGQHNGKDYYRREDSAWFIWWYPFGVDEWWISVALDNADAGWYRASPDMLGAYTAFHAGGVPVFAKTTYEPPADYQIPKL